MPSRVIHATQQEEESARGGPPWPQTWCSLSGCALRARGVMPAGVQAAVVAVAVTTALRGHSSVLKRACVFASASARADTARQSRPSRALPHSLAGRSSVSARYTAAATPPPQNARRRLDSRTLRSAGRHACAYTTLSSAPWCPCTRSLDQCPFSRCPCQSAHPYACQLHTTSCDGGECERGGAHLFYQRVRMRGYHRNEARGQGLVCF